MRAARVVVSAQMTSFRHPFFVTGRQPTFAMPPPSTVFGHCASALGRWPNVEGFWFGIHFTWRARVDDREHQHIASALGGRAKTMVATATGPQRATTEITVQPVLREILFDAVMTLYLPPDLGAAFRSPAHTVVLGRSQDLAEVRGVDEVELVPAERVRIEHTILPWSVRPCVRQGSTVLLSRRIGEPPGRETEFARYVVVREPVFFGSGADASRAFVSIEGVSVDGLWCDPDPRLRDENDWPRGFFIHRISGSPEVLNSASARG